MKNQNPKGETKDIIIRGMDGKTFYCSCGCNVFRKTELGYYRCNSCKAEYEGK